MLDKIAVFCCKIRLTDNLYDALPDDVETLKIALRTERENVRIARAAQLEAEAIAAIAQAQIADTGALIEHLKLSIAKARQERWGPSSERSIHLIDQLEMQLEDVVTAATEDELAAEMALAKARASGITIAGVARRKPGRGPFPDQYPRHRIVVPAPKTCSCCNGAHISKMGASQTDSLEVIPRQWIVLETVREKFVCRGCGTITQPPAPFHPISRGRAGPNLLAMILFNKFGLHQPLNRQSETYAAEGVALSVSTLADYVGHCTVLLPDLVKLIEAHIEAGPRIHHDDTTVPVLAKGKTITGRIWASLRDDCPFGGADLPAVVFYYTRDRTKEHPRDQLSGYAGILQADAYAGYDDLYKPGRAPRPLTQASCWAHARRDFYKQAKTDKTPLALETVRRMDAIFTAERTINGQSAEDRLAYRQVHIAPLVNDLETWLRAQYGTLSRKGDLAKAINYMLCRWDSFSRFLDDGRICLTNNAAERLIRTVAIGR